MTLNILDNNAILVASAEIFFLWKEKGGKGKIFGTKKIRSPFNYNFFVVARTDFVTLFFSFPQLPFSQAPHQGKLPHRERCLGVGGVGGITAEVLCVYV